MQNRILLKNELKSKNDFLFASHSALSGQLNIQQYCGY